MNENNEWNELDLKFKSLSLWTPELIEWIGETNNPIELSVASCLINTRRWPEWVPGKPANYDEPVDDVTLFFEVEVVNMLKDKCERIAPKLHNYIWLTQYYMQYKHISPIANP